MITIPRSLCRDLRAVFRKLAPTRSAPHPPVELVTGPDRLSVRCVTGTVAVLFRRPDRLCEARLLVPPDPLNECGGRDDSPVTFAPDPDRPLGVNWTASGVPHARTYDAPARADPPPTPPDALTAVPTRLLAALDAASQVTAKESARYALNHLQLKGGTGEVVASDGKQLLVESGFSFPWTDDVLVPRTAVFGVLAALDPGAVSVGKTATHVWVSAGPWAVALAVDPKGRFPDVVGALPRASSGGTTLSLDPADAAGLAAVLPGLPGKVDDNRPVTLDLNGHAAVRAKGDADPRPVELELPRSRVEGGPVRIACDRSHLLRAIQLGFPSVRVLAPDRPVACREGNRTYGWMPLVADVAIEPSPDAVAVRLPTAAAASRPVKSMPTRREAKQEKSPARRAVPRRSSSRSGGGLVEEALAVRDALKALLGRVRALVEEARRQQHQHRLVRATLASLRQLQTVG